MKLRFFCVDTPGQKGLNFLQRSGVALIEGGAGKLTTFGLKILHQILSRSSFPTNAWYDSATQKAGSSSE